MKEHLGTLGIWLALVASVIGGVILVIDLVRRSRGRTPLRSLDARLLVPVVALGAIMATAAMQWGLITHDFHLAYVAENNAKATPLIYSITGMWSALEGSILLWGLVLSFFMLAVIWRYRRKADDPVVGWAVAVLFGVAAFFFGLMIGPADPFVTTGASIPSSGAGPNALLQNNPLVAIHPPLLYAGMVGFSVPFAFAIAMLITGRVGEGWHVDTRRWALIAWTSLSVGIVLGAWWSYQVLGWGGFLGWDPVENAALMPWLCGTAFVHSIVVEERRGLLRVWNISLAVATFSLTILGTFFTRSGVVQSVHAFSSSTMGPLLIGFFALVVLCSLALIAWRGDQLRSSVGIDAAFSREGAFVLNNLLFVGFALIVLLGTVFPMLYEALNGGQVTVGAPYFNAIAVPLGIGLLTLMAIAPVLSWRKASLKVAASRLEGPAWAATILVVLLVAFGVRGITPLAGFFLGGLAASSAIRSLALEFRSERHRGASGFRALIGRSGGGMVVHVGVVILAVGIVASTSYATRGEVVLAKGQTVTFAGHRIEFLGMRTVQSPAKSSTQVVLKVDGGGTFTPGVSQFAGRASEPVGSPAIDSGAFGDVYLTFDAIGGKGGSSGAQVARGLKAGSVAVGIVVEPLLPWLWAGGLVMGLGGLLAFVPTGTRRRRHVVSTPEADLVPTGAPADEPVRIAP
ncbi:MAG: cytochrome c-type biogenesis CcmF C-terminal domain-containing protein [Actinomycetes bacterium]